MATALGFELAAEPTAPAQAALPRLLFGATILASSSLLFLVQPLVSKLILPWFGGSAAVWIMSMLFFQTGLLLGYLYAHALTRLLKPSSQPRVHGILLTLSVAALPILPNAMWQPKPGADPTWNVLGILATAVGVPYVLLSSTSPLLQSWYAARQANALPYRYFALSNAGSLAALLAYPVIVEPNLRGHNQAWLWSGAYWLFAILCITVAAMTWRKPILAAETGSPSHQANSALLFLWLALPACATALLLTVTNVLTQNIAPMPLLWVVPLCIYLLSFILSFESEHWYQRWIYIPFLLPALYWLVSHTETIESADVKKVAPLICLALFICCMACHGELARLKPGSDRLTAFYLSVSAGGVLGGAFVALFAPRFFKNLYEYPIACVACALLILAVFLRERAKWWKRDVAQVVFIFSLAATVALAAYIVRQQWKASEGVVARARNFYGALQVDDFKDNDYTVRQLSHGTIVHGAQILDSRFKQTPVTYYAHESGIGMTFEALQKTGPLTVGVIGLGAGSLAAYGRGGDTFRFYDLNPEVVKIARTQFTYLADCPAHVDVVLGDARLSLTQEKSQQFDIIVLDAFAGDAIPIHLLTREAFDVYWRHLKPNGVLAVHVSNQYLNLEPIVKLDSDARHIKSWSVNSEADDSREVDATTYVLVSNRPGFFESELLKGAISPITVPAGLRPWTDDFSNLWRIIRLGGQPL